MEETARRRSHASYADFRRVCCRRSRAGRRSLWCDGRSRYRWLVVAVVAVVVVKVAVEAAMAGAR
jgi:hypothetical protein